MAQDLGWGSIMTPSGNERQQTLASEATNDMFAGLRGAVDAFNPNSASKLNTKLTQANIAGQETANAIKEQQLLDDQMNSPITAETKKLALASEQLAHQNLVDKNLKAAENEKYRNQVDSIFNAQEGNFLQLADKVGVEKFMRKVRKDNPDLPPEQLEALRSKVISKAGHLYNLEGTEQNEANKVALERFDLDAEQMVNEAKAGYTGVLEKAGINPVYAEGWSPNTPQDLDAVKKSLSILTDTYNFEPDDLVFAEKTALKNNLNLKPDQLRAILLTAGDDGVWSQGVSESTIKKVIKDVVEVQRGEIGQELRMQKEKIDSVVRDLTQERSKYENSLRKNAKSNLSDNYNSPERLQYTPIDHRDTPRFAKFKEERSNAELLSQANSRASKLEDMNKRLSDILSRQNRAGRVDKVDNVQREGRPLGGFRIF